MYVNPFWFGVACTIMVEFGLLLVGVAVTYHKAKRK